MKNKPIKINILKELLWYYIYNKLAKRYPFASKQYVINKTNEFINNIE